MEPLSSHHGIAPVLANRRQLVCTLYFMNWTWNSFPEREEEADARFMSNISVISTGIWELCKQNKFTIIINVQCQDVNNIRSSGMESRHITKMLLNALSGNNDELKKNHWPLTHVYFWLISVGYKFVFVLDYGIIDGTVHSCWNILS